MPTIYALATPPGKSGVAVIRVSGAGARASLAALGVVQTPPARQATLTALTTRSGAPLDSALVLFFPAPHSFTGEDVVEYHVHGSRAVFNEIFALFAALPDFRPADPGEFSQRAFLNGKMDLTMAEGLADLIDAETEAQRRQAVRTMRGEAAAFYEALRQGALQSLALLEAYIDFPDEEIPPQVLAEIDMEVAALIIQIEGQLADKGVSETLREGIAVAIVGPPNVGKSSLLNLLAGREAAIVSSIAGTTRDVIDVRLDLKGYPVILSDTAGIRDNAESIEAEGIRRSFARAREADLTIVVLDGSQTEAELSSFRDILQGRCLVLRNKSDLPLPSSAPVFGVAPLAISVRDKTGIEAFLRRLEDRIEETYGQESSHITRARHRLHLSNALIHLKNYRLIAQSSLELRCEELRRASAEIGKITGKIAVDELLGHIFSRFCIGK